MSTSLLTDRLLPASARTFYAGVRQAGRAVAQRALYRYLRAVDVPEGEGRPRVVFNLGGDRPSHVFLLESYLAAVLVQRGAEARVLVDDLRRTPADGMDYADRSRGRELRLQARLCEQLVGPAPLYRPYSTLLTEADQAWAAAEARLRCRTRAFDYAGVGLEKYVISSVIRYYRSAPVVVEREPGYDDVFEAFLANALLNVRLAERVEAEMRPEVVVTSHGFYAAWGPFYEYFQRRGVRAVVYGLGKRERRSIRLSNEGLVATKCDDGFFEEREASIDLGEAEAAVARSLARRQGGGMPDVERLGLRHDHRVLAEVDRWRQGERVCALFPNVLWDASLSGTDHAFTDAVDWLLETVRHFLACGRRLLIRAHPAEARVAKLRPRVFVEDVLREAFGASLLEGHETVFFIPAEVPLPSYALFDRIEAGLTYNGTIGLELMYHSLPVLVGGACHYAGRPFCPSLDGRAEYYAALDDLPALRDRQQAHRATLVRYLHYFLHLAEIELDVFVENSRLIADPHRIVHDERLAYIADTILGRHDFYQDLLLGASAA